MIRVAVASLDEWLTAYNIPGIYGIDTRQVIKVIRAQLIRQHSTKTGSLISSISTTEQTKASDIKQNRFFPCSSIPKRQANRMIRNFCSMILRVLVHSTSMALCKK